jgi:glycosyltransferase involved in cell wall biosynthesis
MTTSGLRVLHAAETVRGGVATVLRQLLEAQSKTCSVSCVAPRDQALDLQAGERVLVDHFERSGRNAVSLLRFAVALFRACLDRRPDVVHLHSSFAGLVGRIVVALLWPVLRPKVVYCPHAFSFLISTAAWKRKLYVVVERLLLVLSDAVICVSEYEREAAVLHGLRSAKLLVIENGVPPVARGGQNPYGHGVINALFVGRLDHQKGFDVLLSSMDQLRDIPILLTVVGGGVHDAPDLPNIPNVRYAGWLQTEEIAPYYEFADLLVVPSRWEGFGLVVVEAASVGLPTLASRCCSLPELVRDGESGLLFSPEDGTELAEVLRTVDRDSWRSMGRKALERYSSRYTSERMVLATSNLYSTLLGVAP